MATSVIPLPYTEAISIRNRADQQEYANKFDIYQIGRLVIFSFQGQNKERSEGIEIFTVQEGYRPRFQMFYTGLLGTTPCIFSLGTDGKCIIYLAPSYPTSRAYVSGVYVI